MLKPRILILAGTQDAGSPVSRLAGAALREIAFLDAEAVMVSLADYTLPLREPGLAQPAPPSLRQLRGLIGSAEAVLVVTGAALASVPAAIQNLFEWLAAEDAGLFHAGTGRIFAIAAIAGTEAEAAAAGEHLRSILTAGLGASLVGERFALSASEAFDERDRISEPRRALALQQLIGHLLRSAPAAAPNA